jgi:hypothetical protein
VSMEVEPAFCDSGTNRGLALDSRLRGNDDTHGARLAHSFPRKRGSSSTV